MSHRALPDVTGPIPRRTSPFLNGPHRTSLNLSLTGHHQAPTDLIEPNRTHSSPRLTGHHRTHTSLASTESPNLTGLITNRTLPDPYLTGHHRTSPDPYLTKPLTSCSLDVFGRSIGQYCRIACCAGRKCQLVFGQPI